MKTKSVKCDSRRKNNGFSQSCTKVINEIKALGIQPQNGLSKEVFQLKTKAIIV